ncbi:MAG: hypothetical protein Q8M92_03795 [Candidatus Subteraquimicrobiales bacterium]|nr:hypothetical protein [Candidatus Subteraquimicrobiales bacterium]
MGREIEIQNKEEMAVIRNRQSRIQLENKQEEQEELILQMKKEISSMKGTVTKLTKRVKTVEGAQ